jgi:hypothetical protein
MPNIQTHPLAGTGDALDIAGMYIGQFLVLLATERGEPIAPLDDGISRLVRQPQDASPFFAGEIRTAILLILFPFLSSPSMASPRQPKLSVIDPRPAAGASGVASQLPKLAYRARSDSNRTEIGWDGGDDIDK